MKLEIARGGGGGAVGGEKKKRKKGMWGEGGKGVQGGGEEEEEEEEEEGEGEGEDWHWWQNLRHTLCMLRQGLSRSGLAR